MYDNKKTKTIKKHSAIIGAATIMVVVASAAMILGTQTHMWQNALAQSNGTTTTTATANTTVTVSPSQSTSK
jgi:hypothetical protein